MNPVEENWKQNLALLHKRNLKSSPTLGKKSPNVQNLDASSYSFTNDGTASFKAKMSHTPPASAGNAVTDRICDIASSMMWESTNNLLKHNRNPNVSILASASESKDPLNRRIAVPASFNYGTDKLQVQRKLFEGDISVISHPTPSKYDSETSYEVDLDHMIDAGDAEMSIISDTNVNLSTLHLPPSSPGHSVCGESGLIPKQLNFIGRIVEENEDDLENSAALFPAFPLMKEEASNSKHTAAMSGNDVRSVNESKNQEPSFPQPKPSQEVPSCSPTDQVDSQYNNPSSSAHHHTSSRSVITPVRIVLPGDKHSSSGSSSFRGRPLSPTSSRQDSEFGKILLSRDQEDSDVLSAVNGQSAENVFPVPTVAASGSSNKRTGSGDAERLSGAITASHKADNESVVDVIGKDGEDASTIMISPAQYRQLQQHVSMRKRNEVDVDAADLDRFEPASCNSKQSVLQTPSKQPAVPKTSSTPTPSKFNHNKGDEWKEATVPGSDGKKYYYNRRTRESLWKLPSNAVYVPTGNPNHPYRIFLSKAEADTDTVSASKMKSSSSAPEIATKHSTAASPLAAPAVAGSSAYMSPQRVPHNMSTPIVLQANSGNFASNIPGSFPVDSVPAAPSAYSTHTHTHAQQRLMSQTMGAAVSVRPMTTPTRGANTDEAIAYDTPTSANKHPKEKSTPLSTASHTDGLSHTGTHCPLPFHPTVGQSQQTITATPPRNQTQSTPPRNQAQSTPPRNQTQSTPPRNQTQSTPPRNQAQSTPPRSGNRKGGHLSDRTHLATPPSQDAQARQRENQRLRKDNADTVPADTLFTPLYCPFCAILCATSSMESHLQQECEVLKECVRGAESAAEKQAVSTAVHGIVLGLTSVCERLPRPIPMAIPMAKDGSLDSAVVMPPRDTKNITFPLSTPVGTPSRTPSRVREVEKQKDITPHTTAAAASDSSPSDKTDLLFVCPCCNNDKCQSREELLCHMRSCLTNDEVVEFPEDSHVDTVENSCFDLEYEDESVASNALRSVGSASTNTNSKTRNTRSATGSVGSFSSGHRPQSGAFEGLSSGRCVCAFCGKPAKDKPSLCAHFLNCPKRRDWRIKRENTTMNLPTASKGPSKHSSNGKSSPNVSTPNAPRNASAPRSTITPSPPSNAQSASRMGSASLIRSLGRSSSVNKASRSPSTVTSKPATPQRSTTSHSTPGRGKTEQSPTTRTPSSARRTEHPDSVGRKQATPATTAKARREKSSTDVRKAPTFSGKGFSVYHQDEDASIDATTTASATTASSGVTKETSGSKPRKAQSSHLTPASAHEPKISVLNDIDMNSLTSRHKGDKPRSGKELHTTKDASGRRNDGNKRLFSLPLTL